MNAGFGQGGASMQGGQAFVGRDSGDMASVFNQLGRNSNRFFQQMNRAMGGGRNNRNATAGQENVAPPVRVQLNVGFERQARPTTYVASAVQGRLDRILTKRGVTAPNVDVVGDTVVLNGIVESESQAMMIERLVRMEPGVAVVDNRLQLAPAEMETETIEEPSSQPELVPPEPPAPPLPPQDRS
jgi:osmotically-inducible protein OsmY